MYKGADISSEDAPIFMGLMASSLDFVIPREGYGLHRDLTFNGYVREAKEVGLKIPAIYHTIESYKIVDVAEEATRCVNHSILSGLPKTTVIFGEIDYEFLKSVSLYGNMPVRETVFSVLDAWSRTVKGLGYNVGFLLDSKIYSKIGFSNRKYVEDNGALWLVDVHGDPDYPCAIHKYTHHGMIEGMKRDAELNLWYDEELYKGKLQNEKLPPTMNDVRDFYKKYLNKKITKLDVGEFLNTYNENCQYYKCKPIKPDEDWSAVFVSVIAVQTNAVGILGFHRYPSDMILDFSEKGIWNKAGEYSPKIGDIAVLNSNKNDRYSVGFITAIRDDKITMIGVDEISYLRVIVFDPNDSGLLGYASPKYRVEEKEN